MSIQFKRSNTIGKAPLLADLKVGEIAINMADKQIYTNNGTEIVKIGGSDASKYLAITGGTLTGQLVLNNDPSELMHPSTKRYADGKPTVMSGFDLPQTANDGSLFFSMTPESLVGDYILPVPSQYTSVATNVDGTLTVAVVRNTANIVYSYDQINWYKSQPIPSIPNYSYLCVAGTKDGKYHIAAGITNTYIEATDGARTWISKPLPGTGARTISKIAISQNRQRIFMSGANEILVSQNGGTTWTVNALATGTYEGLAMSDDGMRGIVSSATSGKNSYYTVNGGVTWTLVLLPDTAIWNYANMSQDGMIGMITSSSPTINYALKTIDGGVSYTKVVYPETGNGVFGAVMSYDGTKVVLIRGINRQYTTYSDDSITTFKTKNATNSISGIVNLAASANLTKIIGVTSYSNNYMLADSGYNWSRQRVAKPAELSNMYFRKDNAWIKDGFFNKFGGDVVGDINMNNATITGLYEPKNVLDLTNKRYVDKISDHYVVDDFNINYYGKNTDTLNHVSVYEPAVEFPKTTVRGNRVFFGETSKTIFVSYEQLFYQTYDSGKTWSVTTSPYTSDGAAYTERSRDGQKLFQLATNYYVRYSHNGGTTWTTTANVLPYSSRIYFKMTTDCSMGFVVFSNSAGVVEKFYTTDSGKTWTASNSLPINLNARYNYNAYAMSDSGNNCYLGIAKPGTIEHSVDGGATWTNMTIPTTGSVTTITLSRDGLIGSLVTTLGEVMYTTDGVTWIKPVTPAYNYDFISSSDDGMFVMAISRLVASTSVLRSFDGGQTWEKVLEVLYTNNSNNPRSGITVSPSGDVVIITTNTTNGLYVSYDQGLTWSSATKEVKSEIIGSYVKVDDVWRDTDLSSTEPVIVPSDVLTSEKLNDTISGISGKLYDIENINNNIDYVPLTEVKMGNTIIDTNLTLASITQTNTLKPYTEKYMEITTPELSQLLVDMKRISDEVPLTIISTGTTMAINRTNLDAIAAIKAIIDSVVLTEVNTGTTSVAIKNILDTTKPTITSAVITGSYVSKSPDEFKTAYDYVKQKITENAITASNMGRNQNDLRYELNSIPALKLKFNNTVLTEVNTGKTNSALKLALSAVPSFVTIYNQTMLTELNMNRTSVSIKSTIDDYRIKALETILTQTNTGKTVLAIKNTLDSMGPLYVVYGNRPLTVVNTSSVVNINKALADIAYYTNTDSLTSVVRIGTNAGLTTPGTYCVAIGNDAGKTNQHDNTVCVGNGSGTTVPDQVVLGTTTITTVVSKCDEYANNTEATAAGLVPGTIYRTGDLMKIVY